MTDYWNVLDFVIVITGFFDLIGLGGDGLTLLRVLRILRPLRAINRLPGLRVLVTLLLQTLPMLGSVVLLCSLIFFSFAILGVQLWKGLFRQRCFMSGNNSTYWELSDTAAFGYKKAWSPYLCSITHAGYNTCDKGPDEYGFPGVGAGYSECREGGGNPRYGVLNFDNIYNAWVTTFLVGTMEGWTEVQYDVMDVYSPWGCLYFVTLILVGSALSLNLFLVVLTTQFGNTKVKEIEAMVIAQAEALLKQQRDMDMYAEAKSYGWRPSYWATIKWRFYGKIPQVARNELEKLRLQHATMTQEEPAAAISAWGEVRPAERVNGSGGGDQAVTVAKQESWVPSKESYKTYLQRITEKEEVKPPGEGAGVVEKVQWEVRLAVQTERFSMGIMIVILLNTVMMGVEHHGQPAWLDDMQAVTNIIFSCIFALEMILKLFAFGPSAYASDSINLCDAFVVGASILELGMGGGSGISVLRAFRLMRVFKLFTKLKGLQRQMAVIMIALPDVIQLCILIILFTFMYAILGMYLFGARFNFKTDEACISNYTTSYGSSYGSSCTYEVERANFDNLYWSFITVFQVLTIEDFPRVMISGVRAGGSPMAVYFISLIIIGNFILCNLVVVILLEGFETRANEEDEMMRICIMGTNKNQALVALRKIVAELARDKRNYMFQKWANIILESIADEEGPKKASPRLNASSHRLSIKASPGGVMLLDTNMKLLRGLPPSLELPAMQSSSQGFINSPLYKNEPIIVASVVSSEYHHSDHHSDALLDMELDALASEYAHQERADAVLLDGLAADYVARGKSIVGEPITAQEGHGSGSGRGVATGWANNATERVWPAGQSEMDRGVVAGLSGGAVGTGNSAGRELVMSIAADGSEEVVRESKEIQGQGSGERGTEGLDEEVHDSDRDSDWGDFAAELGIGVGAQEVEEEEVDTLYFNYGRSLFCFEQSNPARALCKQLVSWVWFDRIVLIFILFSSITMAVERPAIKDSSMERAVLDVLNWVWTVVFFLEFVIKIVAWGFIFGPAPTYVRDTWNCLDGSLVLVSIVDVVFKAIGANSGGLLRILRIARLLRALRPLRLISRAPKLKLVVRTLMMSMSTIGNTVTIAGVIFLIFAILGIQLFSGKMQYCADRTGARNETVKYLSDCAASGGSVETTVFNYDHIGNALLTLFYVASFDGWVKIMYNGVDAVGMDMNMQRDHNPGMALFFVAFLVVGNFMVLNLFFGVIVHSFQRALQPVDDGVSEQEQAERLREETRLAEEAALRQIAEEAIMADISYIANYDWWQLSVWEIATSPRFEVLITVIITSNVLTMAMEHHGESEMFSYVLLGCNLFFNIVFTVEAIIKLLAFGLYRYFGDAWNRFDFFVVLITYPDSALPLITYLDSALPVNPSILRIMRVFRIVRILKLFKTGMGVRALLHCVFQSLGQINNMCILLGLYFCIYAAAGVELFGRMGCVQSRCVGLSAHSNFAHFGMALLTLFRICTGDNGNAILRDAMREPPDCDSAEDCKEDCCASQVIAPIYMMSFIVVAQFVILNVVVSVLMAQFEESQSINDESFQQGLIIEAESKVEGRQVLRSDSVQALVKLREGKMQKPRDTVEKQVKELARMKREEISKKKELQESDEDGEVVEAFNKVHSVKQLQNELGLASPRHITHSPAEGTNMGLPVDPPAVDVNREPRDTVTTVVNPLGVS